MLAMTAVIVEYMFKRCF